VKLKRRWIAVLLVVAVLLLALTLAVRFLLPVDRFVMAALDDLRALSGAELAVGVARVDLWPTPRIVLTGVAAHGSGADLDELGVPASAIAAWTLTVKSVTARPDWRELVSRRAVLRDVRLDQPRLEWTAVDGGALSVAQAAAATIAPVPGLLRVNVERAGWYGVEVSADAELAGWPGPGRLQGEWRLEACDTGTLFAALPRRPALGATPVAGLADGNVDAEGHFDWPWPLPAPLRFRDLAPGLTGQAEVSDLAVAFAGNADPWTVRARAELQAGRFEVRDAVIGIGDGRVTGHLTLADLDRDAPQCSFGANCEDVVLAEMLRVLAPGASAYVVGTADAEVRGNFACGSTGTAAAGLALEALVAARDGVVHAQDWLTGIAPYLGERQDLQDIRYRSLTCSLVLHDGRLAAEDLKLEGPDTDWRGRGWLALAGPLDLSLVVKLPAGFRPDLGSMSQFADLLKGDDGRIALGLRLTGRSAAPVVNLELGASGRQAAWR
jgi:hypothetical protein